MIEFAMGCATGGALTAWGLALRVVLLNAAQKGPEQ